jgi:hypothetical protein
MITEQQLKSDCTPEIIKKMVELAEGFKMYDSLNRIDFGGFSFPITEEDNEFYFYDTYIFPLLIHRAVEGWNKNEKSDLKEIIVYNDSVKLIEYKKSREGGFDPFAIVIKKFENYQPSSLTPCECACLHCLIEVLG